MAEARRQYDQQARWEDFRQRAADWRAIADQREFLALIRAQADTGGPWPDGLVDHLDFVERRLDEIDPLKHLELVLPDLPDPKPDDLKPFLDGWSPSGPGAMGW